MASNSSGNRRMIFLAYIDPGSGGYLFGSLLAWIGGGLALGSAVVFHFFKHTLKKFPGALRDRRTRVLFIVTAAILIIAGAWLWRSQRRHLSSEGGLIPVADPAAPAR